MKFAYAVIVSAVLASTLQADILYTDGTPDYLHGDELGFRIEADSFSFSAASTITHVMFQGLSLNPPANYTGSVYWFIYSNASGIPGTTLASGFATPPAVDIHDFATYSAFQFDFDIAAFPVTAGTTYWLGLHNGPTSPFLPGSQAVSWAAATGGIDPLPSQSYDLSSASPVWGQAANPDHYFQLSGISGVPEPSTWLMVSVGLALATFLKRKK